MANGTRLRRPRRCRDVNGDNSVIAYSNDAIIRTGGEDAGRWSRRCSAPGTALTSTAGRGRADTALPRKRCAMRRIVLLSWGELSIAPGQRSGATRESHRRNLQGARGAPPKADDAATAEPRVLIDSIGQWGVRHRPGSHRTPDRG